MAKQKENIPVIFTLSLGGKDAMLQRINKEKPTIVTPIFSLKVNENSSIPDKDRIMREVVTGAEKEQKTPIANIQFSSNEFKPIVDLQDLKNYKNLGIKTSFTFNNYKSLSQESELNNIWQELLANVDHVFFTSEQDQSYAIADKLIPREKTTNIQNESPENLVSIFNNLANNKPATTNVSENILLSGTLPDKTKLNELVKTAKDQGKRIVMSNVPLSTEKVSNAIALKFGIENQDQLLGIKLEVADILKNQANSAKDLEKYIAQLSQQFQKDLGGSEINPIDIYFDIKNEQNMTQAIKNDDNNVRKPSNSSILSQEIRPLEQSTLQSPSNELPKKVAEDKLASKNIFSKIFNYVQNLNNSFKGKVFGKEEEMKATESSLGSSKTSQTKKFQWEELGITKEEYTKMLEEAAKVEQQLASSNNSNERTQIPKTTSPANKESLALVSSINDVVKPDYLYTDDNIKQILASSLSEPKKVNIQQISLAWPNDLKESILLDIVKEIREERKEYSLIPIETGGEHWAGMVATYNKKNDEVTFTYNDPLGNPIDHRPELQDLIKKVEPTAIIIDLKTPQQENAYDCGVFVCDNLTKIAKGQKILSTEQSKGAGNNLRKAHAEILNTELSKQQAQEIGNNAIKQNSSFVSRTNSNNKERTR